MSEKVGITDEFLEKHRSKTRRYMDLLKLEPKKTTKTSSETLSRIQTKWGLDKKLSQEPRSETRVSYDENSIQEFIKKVRLKYLKPQESQEHTPRSSSNSQTPKAPQKPDQTDFLETPLIDLSSPQKSEDPFKGLEELESLKPLPDEEPEQPQEAPKLPVTKPPLDASTYVTPEKEEPQENSLSMSIRKARAEQVINKTISGIITSMLGLRGPKQSPPKKKSSNRLPTFEEFLESEEPKPQKKAILKFTPVKKTPNLDQIYKEDTALQKLLETEKGILNDLKRLYEEKSKLKARFQEL